MSKHEKIWGNVLVSIIGGIIAIGIASSIIDILRLDWKHLGSYGPYKANAEFETVDGDF